MHLTQHSDYPYFYETHLHTSQGSRCGYGTGAEMAEACREAGYTGIFVTDHHWGGNTRADRRLPWADWCDAFCEGYYDARRRGGELGLDVWFGWEAGFDGTEFLIYGLSPAWMKAHPEIRTVTPFVRRPDYTPMTVAEQYRIIRAAGGMVIQAHPFREEPYIPEVRLYPDLVDGVEAFNAAHCFIVRPGMELRTVFNDRALAYAKERGLPVTAGSDIHSVELFGGGIAFRRKLRDARDFCTAIMNNEDRLLCDGTAWYDRNGNPIKLPSPADRCR